ncbi:MAG: ABC transporter ATP-binding protein [Chloroflexi bacterium]|nr:ABC transporter ATP-binding protein [Chloroflexota bacterium]
MAGLMGALAADTYDRQYKDSYLFRRLGTYFRPYLRQVALITVMVITLGLLGALIPVLLAAGVDALETEQPDSTLLLLFGALLVVAVTNYGTFWLRRRLSVQLVSEIISQMRKDAFAAAVDRDLGFYDDNKSGKVVSRITSDTQELYQIILISLDIVSQLLEFVLLLIVLFSRDVGLTLILLAMSPMLIAAALIFRYLARLVTRQGSRAMAEVNDNIQESVSGISVAKNFRQEAMIYEAFDRVNRQSYGINLRRGFVLALVFPVLNALGGIATGLISYVGATFVISGAITASAWFLFIQGVDRFWFPFINLASFWSQLQQGLSAIERIFALIDADNTVIQTDDRPTPEPMAGQITFERVSFAYKAGGDPVLQNFNLTIQPGENVAFVGHTGAGKSTITKLIARFYEFQDGAITIDGQDIRSFNMQAYRSRLGIVPQAPFLFSGTIIENISYACPNATEDEINEIAHSIGGGEWLETLPNGLQTDVGERGARLSMGQRQLVSLMRVLVQQPAIFILDEATASIDPFTETQIQEALEMILARTTSILIAHRLSTVRSADRIIVLRFGEIIEEGDHSALMTQGGHYAELYNTYFRHQSLSYIEHARSLLTD